jgi:hypothetical protein
MNKKYRWLVLVAILITLLFVFNNSFIKQEAADNVSVQEPERQVWEGQYTIFQYTQNGWSNHMYVTEFYIEDDFLYYKLKDYPDEYMFIRAEEFLPVPGWIEEPEELMKYGFWEPMDSEY